MEEFIPVRCFSCGKPLANLEIPYKNWLMKGFSKKEALDKINLTRPCCRTAMIAPFSVPMHKEDVSVKSIRPENIINVKFPKQFMIEQNKETTSVIESRPTLDPIFEKPLLITENEKDEMDDSGEMVERDKVIITDGEEINTGEQEFLQDFFKNLKDYEIEGVLDSEDFLSNHVYNIENVENIDKGVSTFKNKPPLIHYKRTVDEKGKVTRTYLAR